MDEQATVGGGHPEPALFDAVLHWSSLGLEAAGVVVVVVGALVAFAVAAKGLGRGADRSDLYHDFRRRLARSILLGLEFLVAADIIGTVAVEPTVDNLLVLGLIVVIRTFLSFSLEVEIEGRWPWRRGPRETDKPNGQAA
jgi:uncharacterized membrane protein